MAEYVDFHYMPLEGKITGKQVLKQTEDAINDLGQHVYEIDIDNEKIQEAIDTSNQAISTAEAALSAVTTNRAMWFNTVSEMKETDIAIGITAATRGKGVFNDGDGAFYAVRSIKVGDVDSDDTVILDNGNVAERIKQFNLIAKGNTVYVANVAELRTSDAVTGNMYATRGYYTENDGGTSLYYIRTKRAEEKTTDSTTAYTKNVPVDVNAAKLQMLGGKTVCMNQFFDYEGIESTTTNNVTMTNNEDGSFSFVTGEGGASAYTTLLTLTHKFPVGHKVFMVCPDGASSSTYHWYHSNMGTTVSSTSIRSVTSAWSGGTWRFRAATDTEMDITFTPQWIDLTQMFGAGNEPSSVSELRKILPATYYAYSTGSLVSASINDIISKDPNDLIIQTVSIPNDIRSLSGYGWSCPNHYNYVDFVESKFVQEVGSRAYASGDESDATVITDGTNTYYALPTPVEVSISPTDIEIGVEPGGTLNFVTYLDNDYCIPIPSTELFVNADTDDGGSIIFLDNGNVAEMVTDGEVNIRQFGAKGDGVTDCSIPIINAINFSKRIYIPNGTYMFSKELDIPDGMYIYGNNENSVLLYTGTGRAIVLKGCFCTFRNFILKADTTVVSADKIGFTMNRMHGAPKTISNIIISGLLISYFDYAGIDLNTVWQLEIENTKIRGHVPQRTTPADYYGIHFDKNPSSPTWSSSGCVFRDLYINYCSYGIYMQGVHGQIIENCIFEYNYSPIYRDQYGSSEVVINNAWFEANTKGAETKGSLTFHGGRNITCDIIDNTYGSYCVKGTNTTNRYRGTKNYQTEKLGTSKTENYISGNAPSTTDSTFVPAMSFRGYSTYYNNQAQGSPENLTSQLSLGATGGSGLGTHSKGSMVFYTGRRSDSATYRVALRPVLSFEYDGHIIPQLSNTDIGSATNKFNMAYCKNITLLGDDGNDYKISVDSGGNLVATQVTP